MDPPDGEPLRQRPGEPARLQLEPDRIEIRPDGLDLSFVAVSVTDKDGLVSPRATDRIRFVIEGPGEIVATDNGDPTSFEPFQSHDRNAFNGRCLVIIRAKPGQSGKINLAATADTLKAGTITLRTAAATRFSPRSGKPQT